jgi:hypothetical protein
MQVRCLMTKGKVWSGWMRWNKEGEGLAISREGL